MLRESESRRFPQATLDLLDELAARIDPDDPQLADWFAHYNRTHRTRLAADLQIVQNHCKSGASILECGAIPLLMTAALSQLDFKVEGLDLAPQRFSAAITSLGLQVHQCDIETEALPYESSSFEVVLFNELFEHLRVNPIFTLNQIHRVLEPGGLLLLSTPNLRSLRGLRNLLIHNLGHSSSGDVFDQYSKLETLGHMGHVREYTSREVADFLGRVGFRVDKVIYRGGHGTGLVGVIERVAPSLRPFFTLVARKGEAHP